MTMLKATEREPRGGYATSYRNLPRNSYIILNLEAQVTVGVQTPPRTAKLLHGLGQNSDHHG